MSVRIQQRFLALTLAETRCPDKIAAIAPSAKKVYVLRERFECGDWDHVRDLFHHVKGAYIVTEPVAARKYFTLEPRKVISRLRKADVW